MNLGAEIAGNVETSKLEEVPGIWEFENVGASKLILGYPPVYPTFPHYTAMIVQKAT